LDGDSIPPPAFQPLFILLQSLLNTVTPEVFFACLAILVLIACSGIMSASEIAFFSISQPELENLRESDDNKDKSIVSLLERPRYLLSTILISNTFVNIGVVITSYYVTTKMFNFIDVQLGSFTLTGTVIEFVFNVIIVTFTLVLFGEATPKVYATHNKLNIARVMSPVFKIMLAIFRPLNWLLVGSTHVLEKRLRKRSAEIDIDEINKAIEITVENKESKQDARILKGVVQFGNINVKQVMRPRMEVAAVDYSIDFKELMEKVLEHGYSRMPVFKETLDNVVGVLYIKDLLLHINQEAQFGWQKLLREPLFVPESKKIDDLLREIQTNRKHLAIVVDEYGGTSGIITLEDIVEEVIGDIKDEFDEAEQEVGVKEIAENVFVFEGKTSILDACRALSIELEFFDEAKGDAETIGGLILALAGRIPDINEILGFQGLQFTVMKIANNRIEEIKAEWKD
jgi:putative hemolysin